MSNIPDVVSAIAFGFSLNGKKVLVIAAGNAPTSGWSSPRLSPRFYVNPPADGIWDFDFLADKPAGMVLQVIQPLTASGIFGAPEWLKGTRVHGENGNAVEVQLDMAAKLTKSEGVRLLKKDAKNALVRQQLASYDDSFNPIGFCSGFSIKMKKLRHTLTLVVEGPDESKIRSCVDQSLAAGLIAAILAVYATGGGALSAAVSAFIANLEGCLGNAFTVKIEDDSYWIEWCT